jgi:ribonucleoside-diphosphate reductase alpha chain
VSSGSGGLSAAKPATPQPAADLLQAAALAAQSQMALSSNAATDIRFCGVDDPTCEACQ